MKHNEWIKKALEYSKQGFEQAFDAAETVNGKVEEYTKNALDNATFVPNQGKDLLRNWIGEGRRVRQGIKDAVLKGHDQFNSVIAAA